MADGSSLLSRIAGAFDNLRKVAVGAGAALVATIVIGAVWRELAMGGIVIAPVVVKASDALDAPAPELAAQQIARHLDRIQRAGAEEWRKAHVDDGLRSVDLVIPGAQLSLRGVAREVVALFGLSPRTLRSAISRKEEGEYSAVVSLVGDHGSMTDCRAQDARAPGLDGIYECIALRALSFADPKVAASFVLHRERKECRALNAGVSLGTRDLHREELRIRNRRENCSFRETRNLIAQILSRGRKDDLPWIPYIYGQIHLARALALRDLRPPQSAAEIDVVLQQQLSEFDQAIGRFRESQQRLPESSSAIAVLMDAHLAKATAIHESTALMPWTDDPKSPLQFRLGIAEQTLAEARAQLAALPASRSRSLDGLVNRHEGVLHYRTWMIAAHRRTGAGQLTVAVGQPEELDLLDKANANFATSESKSTLTFMDYLQWGNIARARGDYDAAVTWYRRAADLAPLNGDPAVDVGVPVLNIVTTYLDRVEHGPEIAPHLHLLVALGALSDYIAWVSEGGPYPLLVPKAKKALARSGDPGEIPAFEACFDNVLATDPHIDPAVERWRAAGALKYCVEAAIVRANQRHAGASERF